MNDRHEIDDGELADLKRKIDDFLDESHAGELFGVLASVIQRTIARPERAEKDAEGSCLRGKTDGANEERSLNWRRENERIATLAQTLRHIFATCGTLSPQEIMNNCASALGIERVGYGGTNMPDKSHIEIAQAIFDRDARIEALEKQRDEAVALTWAHANNDEHATDRCPICAREVSGAAVSIDKLPAGESGFRTGAQ